MDCFYAQVEMRDRPELKNVPLAIGGPPHSRSVLCTSNYLARKFGVKSAMPTDTAIKLCPHLVVLAPQFSKYQKISSQINLIFNKYSHAVETVSLDEAYLDVSHELNATELAKKIQKEIFEVTQLTASVGVAPNKFLAKIASDWKKPNGIFVIKPHEVDQFVKDLPVKCIPGVGKKSLIILQNMGIHTCLDLREKSPEKLALTFGKFSLDLLDYARGKDERDVVGYWERKSLSIENTFVDDFDNLEDCLNEFEELYDELRMRLKEHYDTTQNANKIKKFFVKIKTADFKTATMEESLFPFMFDEEYFNKRIPFNDYKRLLDQVFTKKSSPIRLVGLGVRFLTSQESHAEQLSFFSLCA
jgi:DNA polymerase-4